MNHLKLLAIAAIAATVFFISHKASAAMGVVNISATATFEQDTVVTTGYDTFKAVKKSFKNTDALAVLQAAVENNIPGSGDVSWFTAKGSQLVYDPDFTNLEASAEYGNNVFGAFWVTNATMSPHKGFRLDGDDGSGNYWSLIELDFAPWTLGFSAIGEFNLNGAFNGKYVASPYQYTSKITGNATLYIHDNPYDFDYPDNLGSVVFDNNFAFVLTGPATFSFSYKFDSKSNLYPTKNSISIKGSGDGLWNNSSLVGSGFSFQPVFSGSVSHSDSGKETADQALYPDPLQLP